VLLLLLLLVLLLLLLVLLLLGLVGFWMGEQPGKSRAGVATYLQCTSCI
jgi:hypothetical protein